MKPHERFMAGSLAGATAQTAIYPMEVRYCTCRWDRKGARDLTGAEWFRIGVEKILFIHGYKSMTDKCVQFDSGV